MLSLQDAFPCALTAANGWNEATSPSTSHVRQRNPSSRRLDWAHCRARLDDRSGVRCVRDDVSASPLIDSTCSLRAIRSICGTWRVHYHHRIARCASQASARFWLSMTLFGLQRFHPVVSLPSDPRRGTCFSCLRALPTAKRSRRGSNVGATNLCNFCKPRSRDTW